MTIAASPFVLVHGGRHGGWCWRRVRPFLRGAGHEVHSPTLTGLGERSHLLHPGIGLATHVRDIVAVLEFEDLRDVVLVGHSYGGMVVSGVLEQVADRVRRVVLVDAHLPRTGESVFDLIGAERAGTMREMARRDGGGAYVPVTDASWWGLSDPDDIAWVNRRTTPQPIRTYEDRIECADTAWRHPTTFVECRPSRLSAEELARVRARADVDPRFVHRVLDGTHEPMVTVPAALAGLLLEAAGTP